MTKDEMIEKFKTMSVGELAQYRSAARAANRLIDIVAVLTILLVLMFTNILTIISGVIFVFIIANTSSNISHTIESLEKLIDRKVLSNDK